MLFKLVLNSKFSQGGLYTYILKLIVKLTYNAIFNYPSNQVNHYIEQYQQYQIAKAVAYTLPKVKELELFNLFQPNMPTVNYFPLQRLYHFALGPILENKGTLEGIYSVLKNIFSGDNGEYGFKKGQLGFKEGLFNNSKLVLINSN